MLHLLHEFLDEPGRSVRFGELQNRLALSPKTLSARLKTLVESGLLVRRQFNEVPPRVEYQATERGERLAGVFQVLETWASQNSLHTVRTISVVGRV